MKVSEHQYDRGIKGQGVLIGPTARNMNYCIL